MIFYIYEMDLHDKKILYHLDKDARTPASRIAKHIHLSKEAVNNRIKNLKEKNIIRSSYAIVDASKLGYQAYRIALAFHQSTLEQEREVISYLRKEKTCAHLTLVEGRHNIVFLAMHKEFSSLQKFFEKFMTKYGDIIKEKNIHVVSWHERHNQRNTHEGKHIPTRIAYDKRTHTTLSDKRASVLRVYARDASKSIARVAEELDQEPQNVRYHLKMLEREGIIKGYGVEINQDLVGKRRAIIDIVLRYPKALHKAKQFFEDKKEIVFTMRLLGTYDLSVELVIDDDRRLREIIDEFRSTYKDMYNDYDVSNCYEDYVLTWSPF